MPGRLSSVEFDDTGAEYAGLSPFVSANAQRIGVETVFDRVPKLGSAMDPASFASQADIRAYTEGHKELMLSGTNASSANVGRVATGGISLTTGGTANDQMILTGLTVGGVHVSPWSWMNFVPERQCSFTASMLFNLAVTNIRSYFGFKLTSAFDLSTDADHVLFVFDTTAFGSTWRMHARVGTVDEVQTVTGIAKATPRVLTRAALSIHVNSNREPVFYIDGRAVGQGPALTTGAALKPFMGVQTLTGSARDIYLQYASAAINM